MLYKIIVEVVISTLDMDVQIIIKKRLRNNHMKNLLKPRVSNVWVVSLASSRAVIVLTDAAKAL